MAKVLLVEDDNNLREIYEARLQAEGYEIAAAQDGEQALVVAKDFKPDLVISDVMMPKISGFEMLDILRNTEGLEHTRVIMLTALSQAEDKSRADSLGADRYLVKSQVTLEDIIKAAHDILDGETPPAAAPAAAAPAPTPATDVAVAAAPATQPQPTPATNVPVATAPSEPVQPPAESTAAPAADIAVSQASESETVPVTVTPSSSQTQDDQLLASAENSLQQSTGTPASEPAAAPADTQPTAAPAQPTPAGPAADSSSGGSSQRVIQPVTDNSVKPTLEELLAREEAKEINGNAAAPAQTTTPPTPPAPATPPQTGQNGDFNPHDISL